MPDDPDTTAITQVRQHLVESLRVIDDLERFLPKDDSEAPEGTVGEGGAPHGQ
ncbi:hypothetical protein [Janibacter alittae]|uniref:Uncharacterized protein n=1 Tax=Janibacter alittae TaxID=3115209 RepID=A0ABZ2MLR1_9MICO